jgi:hypothetical protein
VIKDAFAKNKWTGEEHSKLIKLFE